MKLRIANKVLLIALETGDCHRGSTMLRAVAAFPCGARNHPRRYQAAGMVAAFLRLGVSIHQQRFMCDSKRFLDEIEEVA